MAFDNPKRSRQQNRMNKMSVSSYNTNKPNGGFIRKKGRWSEAEDKKLLALIHAFQARSKNKEDIIWDDIEKGFKTRTKKQCRERWLSQLDPTLKKAEWSPEEDARLLTLSKELNKKWADIARKIPGRTENMVKNRWHALERIAKNGGTTKRKRNRNAKKHSSTKPETSAVKKEQNKKTTRQISNNSRPLSCISNSKPKLKMEVDDNDKLRGGFSRQNLSRFMFDGRVNKDVSLSRNNSLDFNGYPFNGNPDVIERHPSFEIGANMNNNFSFDSSEQNGSLKNSRQTSYDLLNGSFLNGVSCRTESPFERQSSFDTKSNQIFPVDRQNSLSLNFDDRQLSLGLDRSNSLNLGSLSVNDRQLSIPGSENMFQLFDEEGGICKPLY